MSPDDLAPLLASHRAPLLRFIERHAGSVLRFESAEDLVQGVHLRAISGGVAFEYRSEKEWLGWLYALARSHLADRRSHWSALKRRPSRLLRLTGGATDDPDAASEPAGSATGPSTFASRREQLATAVRALAVLLPRDRDLVRWHSEGVELDEQARRLGIGYDAAERAHLRALDRFRKAFRLVSRA